MSMGSPHGGAELAPLLLEGEALVRERLRAPTLPALRVS